jgi:hypothetical protein
MDDFQGKHTTPKLLAEDILMNAICVALEFMGENAQVQHLSKAEKLKVYGQSVKVAKRLAKVLHYQPESFPWSDHSPR